MDTFEDAAPEATGEDRVPVVAPRSVPGSEPRGPVPVRRGFKECGVS